MTRKDEPEAAPAKRPHEMTDRELRYALWSARRLARDAEARTALAAEVDIYVGAVEAEHARRAEEGGAAFQRDTALYLEACEDTAASLAGEGATAARIERMRAVYQGFYEELEEQRAEAFQELRRTRRTAAIDDLAAAPPVGTWEWSKAWLTAALAAAQSLGVRKERPAELDALVAGVAFLVHSAEIELGLVPFPEPDEEDEEEGLLEALDDVTDDEAARWSPSGGGDA